MALTPTLALCIFSASLPVAQAAVTIPAAISCPNLAAGETTVDCPWGGLARVLQAEAAGGVVGSEMQKSIKDIAPMITNQIKRDRKRADWIGLWGTSFNFDANALGIIVDPAIIDALTSMADAPARDDRHVCAGIEHTYGYLFSTLSTPYGYKRARWVSGDFDQGFGFTQGEVSPTPAHGTLFSNLTYFLGKTVFRDLPDTMKIIDSGVMGVALGVKNFEYDLLETTHLVEEISLPRPIKIHTDFVKFRVQPANPTPTTNTYLLIYWYEDAADAAHPVKLISAFPISTASFTSYTSGLGEDVVIPTRYNAFISGITDSATPLHGSKRLVDSITN